MKFLTLLRDLLPVSVRPTHILQSHVISQTGRKVIAGPFQGLDYVSEACGSAYYPKLLGCYEKELHNVVVEILQSSPGTIVDIGAAEGYYAVGIASRLKNSKVIAFETEEHARNLMASLAAKNRISNLEIKGSCTVEELNSLERNGVTVIVCDCEGFEEVLLDPSQNHWLENACILVELHPWVAPDIENILQKRFSPTHTIQVIHQADRKLRDFPLRSLICRFVPPYYVLRLINEGRPIRMSWYWMKPKC